jgi:hypothetical protein
MNKFSQATMTELPLKYITHKGLLKSRKQTHCLLNLSSFWLATMKELIQIMQTCPDLVALLPLIVNGCVSLTQLKPGILVAT